MDFGFDVITAEEYERQHALYGPLTQALPKLIAAGIHTEVDLDHILGEAASDGLTQPKFTGTITVKYLRGTPLGKLRAEAFIERTEGVKTFARGYLIDAEGTTVEAEGVFIRPAWARDAG
jgi:hypothetical protein